MVAGRGAVNVVFARVWAGSAEGFFRRLCRAADALLGVGEGIPNPAEPEVLEILYVDGGKLLDALVQEAVGESKIVETTKSEARLGGLFPDGIMESTAIGREADDAPAGMAAIGLDNAGCGRSGERAGLDGGIAEQTIDLGEHQLG